MQLSINDQPIQVSPSEAEALRHALAHQLRRMVSSVPKAAQTPVGRRLLLSSDTGWDHDQAEVQATAKAGVFRIGVGNFRGEVSRADMLRLWKTLEIHAGDAVADLLGAADEDFLDGLLR